MTNPDFIPPEPYDLQPVFTRWSAWWQHELADRPLLLLHAPRADAPPAPPADPVTFWCDTAHIIARAEYQLAHQLRLGEAFPSCWNPISAGFSLFYGARPQFLPDTVYVEPAPCPAGAYPDLTRWRESPWYHLARAQHTAFSLAARGRWAVPPFFGNHEADTLALVLGSERFYLELVADDGEPSEWFQWALDQVSRDLEAIYNELAELSAPALSGFPGSYNHIGPWSPASTLFYDCDVSCNLSPRHFQRWLLPLQVRAMGAVRHRLYHLDGRRALVHLDALLGTPEIDAVQWVPGAGQEAIAQWFPLLHKIQRAGKSLLIYLRPAELPAVLAALRARELRPEGLAMDIWCRDEAEARECLKLVERAYPGRC
ncbi:MAG: hypothetical protein ACYC6L_14125 [Anaerolineae bacterium]